MIKTSLEFKNISQINLHVPNMCPRLASKMTNPDNVM